MTAPKTLIIIPTYNEKENIAQLLEQVFATLQHTHVLIVDDNSPDGTRDIVRQLQKSGSDHKLFMLERPGKLGLGTAYLDGFRWALARDYDYIFEMDADFSHNPKYLPELLKAAGQGDLAIGSRYIRGGGVVNWGPLRKIISLGGSLYSRLILRLPYKDLTGGFKCFSRRVLEAINLDKVESNGYSFQIEMTYRAHLKGFKIKEVPIIFEDRTLGKSKMSSNIFTEAVLMVIKLRMKRDLLRSQ